MTRFDTYVYSLGSRQALVVVVLSLVLHSLALANITIDGASVRVDTDAYMVQFEHGVISEVYNKRTAELYTSPNRGGIRSETGILRRHRGAIWASESTIEIRQNSPDSATMAFRRGENEIILTIEVEAGTGDLLIGGSGIADTTGVYGFQWGCENLDIANVELILPASGGQVIASSSPFNARSYAYPSRRWEAQLAIIQGERGGFFVRGTDNTFRFKEFTFKKDGETMVLGFQTRNQAPWDNLTRVESVVWRFNTYSGDYRIPASIYRHWMEEAFEPWRLSDVPSWVEDIGLVINQGRLDLDQLAELAEEIDPSKTLLYLVSWRKDGYDRNYPDYTPIEGFGDFVKAAHGYGFRVMPHANLVAMHPHHPLYPEFQQYQFRDPRDGRS